MKYFIIFLLGVALGSIATTIYQPTTSRVTSNISTNTATLETPVAVLPPLKKEEEALLPLVKEEESAPVPVSINEEKKETPAENLPQLDFTSINERPVFWPSSVKVLNNTIVPLMEKNRKIADLPLNAGDVLQLSKVFGDGKLEVRAKNLKFEIDSQLTNFEILIREKIKELAARGNNSPAPYVRSGENYISSARPNPLIPVKGPNVIPMNSAPSKPINPPEAEPTADEPITEKKNQSLDDKMNALFTQGSGQGEKDKTKPKTNKK